LTRERQSTIDWRVIGTASDTNRLWRSAAGWIAIALMTGVLTVLAADEDLAPGGLDPAATAMDLTVGLAFLGGAALARAPWRSRLLFYAVGVAWLVGSFLPAAEVAYLGVLVIAVGLFPSGRPRTARDWSLVVLALPLALVVPTKPVLAGLFVAVALSALAVRRWERVAAWFPVLAAAALAVALAASWVVEVAQPRAFDPPLWRLAFELLLLVVALGFPVASWAVVRERAGMADRLLGDDRVVGLEGLAVLLAETLGDPQLGVYRWDPATGGYVGPGGLPLELDGQAAVITVADEGPLAAVAHGRAPAMHDPVIVAAVVEAVRLMATNERRQATQRAELAELEAARGRLLATSDRLRYAVAARLRDEVLRPIQEAASQLRRIDQPADDAAAREALAVAGRELEASMGEILALIDGVPPATLGNGGLVPAIRALAERCPLPVSVSATPDAAADVARETALFYVCSEALANATKHSRASRISINLRRERDDLVIAISDDGVGGARLSGFGLRGLADRLAVYGGRLRVDSPPGAGTTLTARIAG
jgi:signal transduction histidine kinase